MSLTFLVRLCPIWPQRYFSKQVTFVTASPMRELTRCVSNDENELCAPRRLNFEAGQPRTDPTEVRVRGGSGNGRLMRARGSIYKLGLDEATLRCLHL